MKSPQIDLEPVEQDDDDLVTLPYIRRLIDEALAESVDWTLDLENPTK